MKFPNYKLENKKFGEGFTLVIGCDEAGRGCLAGPVVAAAVVLNPKQALGRKEWYKEINDSKKLSAVKRFTLEKLLKKDAIVWGIGCVAPLEIDELNIHHASLLAMNRAVDSLYKKISHGTLAKEKSFVFVDGRFRIPNVGIEQEVVIGGDAKVISVAAASILAKTYRDRLMVGLSRKFSDYGFDIHKGYATVKHRQALENYGMTTIHRKSFCKKYSRATL